MSDFYECVNSLKKHNADFFVRPHGETEGSEVICYSPYYAYNKSTKEYDVASYVYHWRDVYNKDGKFVEHVVYEDMRTKELNENI